MGMCDVSFGYNIFFLIGYILLTTILKYSRSNTSSGFFKQNLLVFLDFQYKNCNQEGV